MSTETVVDAEAAAAFAISARAAEEVLARPYNAAILSAADLMAMDLPEQRWAIPGLLPEGLAILAGMPKLGKSWMVLNATLGVATGAPCFSEFAAEAGQALYYALEDSERRLQTRLRTVLGDEPAPRDLYLSTKLPLLLKGGLDQINRVIDAYPDCKVIAIDTLAKIRGAKGRNSDVYQEDANFGGVLQRLALDRRVAILLVHHLRKEVSSDVFEQISGSTGLTGAADVVMVLHRERNQNEGILHVTGRDIEERALAMRFDPERCTWRSAGEADLVKTTATRDAVLRCIKEADGALSPREVADRLGRSESATRQLMWQMEQAGLLRSGFKRGTYVLPSYN